MPRLFAVYLGGNAAGSNIELHDVQFVVGETIEGTYLDLLRLWYGLPDGLHLDSYLPLEVVERLTWEKDGAEAIAPINPMRQIPALAPPDGCRPARSRLRRSRSSARRPAGRGRGSAASG